MSIKDFCVGLARTVFLGWVDKNMDTPENMREEVESCIGEAIDIRFSCDSKLEIDQRTAAKAKRNWLYRFWKHDTGLQKKLKDAD